MVLNAVAAVATFLVTVFNCVPIASNWDPDAYPDKKCVNFADFVTGTASVAIFTDFLVLLLPTWIVYNLHIARKQKIMLVGILSFGLMYLSNPTNTGNLNLKKKKKRKKNSANMK